MTSSTLATMAAARPSSQIFFMPRLSQPQCPSSGSQPAGPRRYWAEMGVVVDSGLTPLAARTYQAVVPVYKEE
jgi:hypothetical protein